MCIRDRYKSELVLRNLKYCIIDEVDSVLIDEARTPLIISGQSGKSTKLYELCDILARQLQRGEYKGERTKMQAIMNEEVEDCLLYTSPSPRDGLLSRMPSSA